MPTFSSSTSLTGLLGLVGHLSGVGTSGGVPALPVGFFSCGDEGRCLFPVLGLVRVWRAFVLFISHR